MNEMNKEMNKYMKRIPKKNFLIKKDNNNNRQTNKT